MCNRGGLLVAYDLQARRALVTDADCNSWKCAECCKRLAEHWQLRAQAGVREFLSENIRVDFVTITSHEKLTNFAQTEQVWRSAWAKLYQALNRKSPVFEYMIIPEKHRDGRMHVHALWTAGVTRRWLKDNARKRGLGYQVDISQIKDANTAVRYVVKYVGKTLGDDAPAHFRRVRVSRGWADIPEPVNENSLLDWHYIATNGQLQTVYEYCQAEDLTMIDIRSGEIFEDEDLGTIVAT